MIPAKTPTKWMVMSVFGVFICAFLLPILIVALLFCGIISTCISFILKLKYGSKVVRADGGDAVYGKPMVESLPYINTITRLDGQPNLPEIMKEFQRDIIEARNQKGHKCFAKLTQVFDKRLGYYIWKECKNFDMNRHFKLVTIKDLIDNIDQYQDKEFNKPKQKEEIIEIGDNRKISWEKLVNIFMDKYGTKPMEERIPQWTFTILVMNPKRLVS